MNEGDITLEMKEMMSARSQIDDVPQEEALTQNAKNLNSINRGNLDKLVPQEIINKRPVEEEGEKKQKILETALAADKNKSLLSHKDALNNDEINEMINPILFTRGVDADSFYLILSGRVMICSGNEGFMVEQGTFNFMGVETLLKDDYRPDFSAKVVGKTKLLKISRKEYRKALSHIYNR